MKEKHLRDGYKHLFKSTPCVYFTKFVSFKIWNLSRYECHKCGPMSTGAQYKFIDDFINNWHFFWYRWHYHHYLVYQRIVDGTIFQMHDLKWFTNLALIVLQYRYLVANIQKGLEGSLSKELEGVYQHCGYYLILNSNERFSICCSILWKDSLFCFR